jgi:cytoskeletal protein CcmA (bactofilin family)
MKDKKNDTKNRKIVYEEGKISGFFDKDSDFNGELNFKGSFRIDGVFKGKINSDSMLIIGETGKVEAEVRVGHLIINGEIKGNIQAIEKIEIEEKGRVFGTIITPKLTVEEGAYLEANCQTVGPTLFSAAETKKEQEQK